MSLDLLVSAVAADLLGVPLCPLPATRWAVLAKLRLPDVLWAAGYGDPEVGDGPA